MSDIVVLLITSGVGVLAGFAGAFLKHLLDLRTKVDESLRETREPLYQKLWKITDLLPEWPRAEVTYAQLRGMSEQCRRWYFDEGGMFLSSRSRELYTGVQDRLAPLFSEELVSMEDVLVREHTYDEIRSACSALRTSLTDDLLSRRGRRNLMHRLRLKLSAQSPDERRRLQKAAIERRILEWEELDSKAKSGEQT